MKKVSAEKKRAFVDAMVRGQPPALAAQLIGIDRVTAYRWRAADPAFAEAWIEATETKVEMVENQLYRMAMNGDIAAVIFFLKSNRPTIYNRRMEIAVGGDADSPLVVDHLHHGDVGDPWVIMMPENGRDRPEPEALTIEDEADEQAA